jgi:hypothetical protein
MTALSQLAGKRFGNLLVLSRAPDHLSPPGTRRRVRWHCQCDCGHPTIAWSEHLISGRRVSCGCNKITHAKTLNKKHGLTGSREWNSWRGMKERCQNPNHIRYDLYGAHGVKICDRWRDSFKNFLADMGTRPPRTSLDRINPYGDYEPSNCRWATHREQRLNRRRTQAIRDFVVGLAAEVSACRRLAPRWVVGS